MSFLFPWALAVAGLALVPLLLHLVRRDTDRRVAFPALRYLQSAQRQSARSMRIRDWLLVAARAAVIVLLAAAASRPLVGSGDARSHVPTDLLLVLDNTASMQSLAGGRPLLEIARAAADTALSYAGPEDRVWLATPLDGLLLAGGTAVEAVRLLPAIRPSDAGGSLPATVARAAAGVPRDGGRARELHLLSDLAGGSFDSLAALAHDWTVRVLRLRPERSGNASVSALDIGPSLPVPPGGTLTVTATLERFPGTADESVEDGGAGTEARLLVDGRTVGIRSAPWGADVVFSVPAPPPGPHVARVEIDPVGLRSDDGRQAGFNVGFPSRVWLADDAGPDTEFFAAALETLADGGRAQLSSEGDADVLILTAARGADRTRVASGAGPARILLPPADPLSLPAFNERLSRLGVPWVAEPDPASGSLRLAAGEPEVLDGEIVGRRYRLVPAPTPTSPIDSVMLRTSDGDPWLVRGRAAASGTYLLVASPLVPEATGVPTGAGMVELVDAMVNRWSRPEDPAGAAIAGAELMLPARADSLAAPGAPPVSVEGGSPWRPETAGTWRIALRSGTDRESRFLGVNVPAAESDPTPLDEAALARALGSESPAVIEAPEDWTAGIFARRRGRDLSGALLLAALAALALEAWMAGPRRARSSGAARAGGGP